MSFRRKIALYVKTWEGRGYENGIPDEAPLGLEAANLVPSYRRICIAIMKNDLHLESLGFSRPKCRAYMEIKRSELMARGKIKPDPQLWLAL